MNQRREVLLGGLLTVVFGCTHACCQPANARARPTGCMLSDADAEILLARSPGQGLFLTGSEPVIGSSANRNFDRALAQTLSRLGKALEVLPGFGYYDDVDGENAFATKLRKFARADGSVLFGLRLLETTLKLAEHPDIAVTAVCAHEFGHIVQYKHGLHTRLFDGTGTKKRVELHADFLAGFYAGIRKREKPNYNAAVFAVKQRAHGDNNIDNVEHHGTPQERAQAVVRGFETSFRERRPLGEAIETGIQYVSTL